MGRAGPPAGEGGGGLAGFDGVGGGGELAELCGGGGLMIEGEGVEVGELESVPVGLPFDEGGFGERIEELGGGDVEVGGDGDGIGEELRPGDEEVVVRGGGWGGGWGLERNEAHVLWGERARLSAQTRQVNSERIGGIGRYAWLSRAA